ncbi:MAG: serine/threonine-protein kinase, partial [Myxococcota bacterium]
MVGNQAHQRYQVIERLDAGGMAEVFKAKAVSMEGFEKTVAIKRVLPTLTKKERFVRMFLDEARLALFLNHTNIVQTFDIGQADGTYFIVMEFVEGSNLKNILNFLNQRGDRFSVEQAVFITMEICKGLTYAHEKRGPDGEELGIVHRDISPPNVLISRQGEVKIADFGLAKARTQIELTDPGVVKGKFGYLSPEAAQGDTVDAQTDVFAVGIVLWEMLAGKRLFLGKTDMETLQQVRSADIPSLREINPNVPAELERLIGLSLALDKGRRFTTAADMNDELARFLFSRGVAVTNKDISRIVRNVRNEKPQRRNTTSGSMGAIDLLIQGEINKFISLEREAASNASGSRPLSGDEFTPPGEDSGFASVGFEDPRTWADTFADVVDEDVSFANIPSGGAMEQPLAAPIEPEPEPVQPPTPSTALEPPAFDPPPAAPSLHKQPPSTDDAGGGVQTSVAEPVDSGGQTNTLWIIFAILL